MSRILAFLALLPATVPAVARAGCDDPSAAVDLRAEIARAEGAWASIDAPAFQAALGRAEALLPCLGETLDGPTAAAYHRLQALAAFSVQDKGRAIAGFRASLALQPAYPLPTSLAPLGNPLHVLYEAARALGPGAPGEAVPGAPDLVVDGTRGGVRPAERPAVVQVMGAEGGVLWTGLLDPAAALPVLGAGLLEAGVPASDDAPPVAEVPVPAERDVAVSGPARPLLVGGGLAALAAGGLYGLGLAWDARYSDPAAEGIETRADLDALRSRTNAVAATSVVLGVAAGGLIFASFAVRW